MMSRKQKGMGLELTSLATCIASMITALAAASICIFLSCRYYHSSNTYLTVTCAISGGFLLLISTAAALTLFLITPKSSKNSRTLLLTLHLLAIVGSFASGSIWLCRLIDSYQSLTSSSVNHLQHAVAYSRLQQAALILWIASLLVNASFFTDRLHVILSRQITKNTTTPNIINQKASIPYSMGSMQTLTTAGTGSPSDLEHQQHAFDPQYYSELYPEKHQHFLEHLQFDGNVPLGHMNGNMANTDTELSEMEHHNLNHSDTDVTSADNALVEKVIGLAISSPERAGAHQYASKSHDSSKSYDSNMIFPPKRPIRFFSSQGMASSSVSSFGAARTGVSHAYTFSNQSIVIDTASSSQLPTPTTNMAPPPPPSSATSKTPYHIKHWKSMSFAQSSTNTNTNTNTNTTSMAHRATSTSQKHESWSSIKSVKKHKSTSSIFSFLPNSSSSLIQNFKSPRKQNSTISFSTDNLSDTADSHSTTTNVDPSGASVNGSSNSGATGIRPTVSPDAPSSDGSFDFSDIVHTHEITKHAMATTGMLDVAHAAFDTWDVHSEEIKDRYLWSNDDDQSSQSQRKTTGSSIGTSNNSINNRISSAGFTKEVISAPLIGENGYGYGFDGNQQQIFLPKRYGRAVSAASTPNLDTTEEDMFGTVSQYDRERLTNF